MLFDDADAPLVKTWIVKRLENNSDADADVLADYVLALLRHDGDVDAIRKLFEEEIPDFLREDAAAFTDDVLQAVQYRSYIPGAPPPPPPASRKPQFPLPTAERASAAPRFDALPPPTNSYPQSSPPFSLAGSRKRRASGDLDDGDVEFILNSQPPNGHPYKQPRRGGAFGKRGGWHEDSYGPRSYRGPPSFPQPPAFNPYETPLAFVPPPIDVQSIMDNIQFLQSMLPYPIESPLPVYSGTLDASSQRRKKRCREYESKGHCVRGDSCNFEHRTHPYMTPPLSTAVDEYDPNNAALSLPPYGLQPPLAGQGWDVPDYQPPPPTNRRESKKPRRTKGRPPMAAVGPNHDKMKKSIVIQNIPRENFSEDKVREYFSQFGGIEEVSMQKQNHLAVIKFDSWEAANAAWSSPKVIFDNRFVKVYWHREEDSGEATPNGKQLTPNETATAHKPTIEPEIDMESFHRRQLEAQKVYDAKLKKRQEVELERQELEGRQKRLREQYIEAKRQLQTKLRENGIEDDSLSSEISTSNDSSVMKPGAGTAALKAQLAALEQEANQLGLDPDDTNDDAMSWIPGGRGRGRGFRGRGGYAPRGIRGTYGYRGRGGTVEARHAAYAAFSLDNRPKTVVLSGVDFTLRENDEALRQYLFSVGEFQEVQAKSKATHVVFSDRKTAEKFMFGVSASNSINGIEGKIEPTWAATSSLAPAKSADGEGPASRAADAGQPIKGKTAPSADGFGEADEQLEDGEIDDVSDHDHDQGDMDYEAGIW
ncbi:hypothetical protein F4808DRAFT_117589 [Astrocystis sublimbata]|nr:hypothetical protein F4808DRAFT_117589 [Astrocystis sublimbata]